MGEVRSGSVYGLGDGKYDGRRWRNGSYADSMHFTSAAEAGAWVDLWVQGDKSAEKPSCDYGPDCAYCELVRKGDTKRAEKDVPPADCRDVLTGRGPYSVTTTGDRVHIRGGDGWNWEGTYSELASDFCRLDADFKRVSNELAGCCDNPGCPDLLAAEPVQGRTLREDVAAQLMVAAILANVEFDGETKEARAPERAAWAVMNADELVARLSQ